MRGCPQTTSILAAAALLFAFALPSTAAAQTVVASGAGVTIGDGQTRAVVFAGGAYHVFFSNGAELQSVTFDEGTPLAPASVSGGSPPTNGFAVASSGDLVVAVWSRLQGSTYSANSRRGTASRSGIVWQAASSFSIGTGLRIHRPSVAISVTGTALTNGLDSTHAYSGPLSGCGATNGIKPSVYFGTSHVGYCTSAAAAADPSSTTVVALGNGNGLYAAMIGNTLSTSIVAPGPIELGEPAQVRTDLNTSQSGQLTSVASVTTPMDVHHVYRDASLGLTYARQDGADVAAGAAGLDVVSVAAMGASPVLTAPADPSGCYRIAYSDGATLVARHFVGSSATMQPPLPLAAPAAPVNAVSAPSMAAGPAPIVWSEGTTIYFGWPPGIPVPTLVATPPAAPADGATLVGMTASGFVDGCGALLPPGTMFTVGASSGLIAQPDADATLAGWQLVSTAPGALTFTIQAPSSPANSVVVAVPTVGGPEARTAIAFGDVSADAGNGMDAGASSDAGTSDEGEDAGADAGAGADGGAISDADAGPGAGYDGGTASDGGAGEPPGPRHAVVGCECTSVTGWPLLMLPLFARLLRRRRVH